MTRDLLEGENSVRGKVCPRTIDTTDPLDNSVFESQQQAHG